MKNQTNGRSRHACCICHTVFAIDDDNKTSYVHHNGERVDVCYTHILSLVNQPATYFEKLPSRQHRSFNLVRYLNKTRRSLSKKSILDPVAQKTFSIVCEILDTTKLSKYFVGGVAEFIKHGLKPSKYPKGGLAFHGRAKSIAA